MSPQGATRRRRRSEARRSPRKKEVLPIYMLIKFLVEINLRSYDMHLDVPVGYNLLKKPHDFALLEFIIWRASIFQNI